MASRKELEQIQKDRVWRAAKKDRQTPVEYEPIYCQKCKEELYQLVEVEVVAPLGLKDFTKQVFRTPLVTIQGVKFEVGMWICGCEVIPPPVGIQDTRPKSTIREKAPRATDRKRGHERDQDG